MCCLPCRGKVTRPSLGHLGGLRMASASFVLQAPSTHAGAAWGTASVLGPHSCVDGGGFFFWNADRTNNSRKGFKTHSDAIFSGLLSHLPCIKAMSVFSPTCCLWSGRRVPVFLTAGLFGPKMTIFCTFLVKCILGDTLSGNSNSKAKW